MSRTNNVVEGLHWLVYAVMPDRFRARRDAAAWLIEDPVFSTPGAPVALKLRSAPPLGVRLKPATAL